MFRITSCPKDHGVRHFHGPENLRLTDDGQPKIFITYSNWQSDLEMNSLGSPSEETLPSVRILPMARNKFRLMEGIWIDKLEKLCPAPDEIGIELLAKQVNNSA